MLLVQEKRWELINLNRELCMDYLILKLGIMIRRNIKFYSICWDIFLSKLMSILKLLKLLNKCSINIKMNLMLLSKKEIYLSELFIYYILFAILFNIYLGYFI
jgi:hypothetical protein